jgi:hypothetical protein
VTFHRWLLVGLLSASVPAAAQERITISATPRSGQVLLTHTTMEMAMDVAPDATRDGAPAVALPKMNMVLSTSVTGTTTVGVPDEQGRYEARVAMDDISTRMTMNGQPAPFSLPANPLSGQTVTFAYDRDGRMVDMAAPGMDGALETVKKMIMNVAGITSPVTLAVGETATLPTNFSFPMLGGATGSLGMTGEIRITLVSITPDGADRIAHLTATVTSQMSGPHAGASTGGEPGMTLQMSGDGTVDMNVDRGFARSTEMQIAIATTLAMPGKLGASMPPVQMHGTMKIAATTEPR